MAKKSNMEGLDLDTLSGRLAYAIKTRGPTFVAKQSGISAAQISRLAGQQQKTTLENAALISIATGFELKWIAVGEGPQLVDDDLWEHTSSFSKISELDTNQKINISFAPEFLEEQKVDAKQCLAWKIESPFNIGGIKTGYVVVIDTLQNKGSGIFVLESNGQKLIGELHINLDGSAKFKTDINKPDTDQSLTKEQFNGLNIIGRVIWHGGNS